MKDRARFVWFARTGPCYCTGRPVGVVSHDIERLRRSMLPPLSGIDVDVVIAPYLVTPAIGHALHQIVSRADVVTVAYPICPHGGLGGRDGLIRAFGDTVPTLRIEECVSGYPDLLVTSLLPHLVAGESGAVQAIARPRGSLVREPA